MSNFYQNNNFSEMNRLLQMLLKNAVDLYIKVYLRALSYCVIISTLL